MDIPRHTFVRLPNREWAEAASVDLTRSGCCAELLPRPDCDGHWVLLVFGSERQIAEIEAATGVEEEGGLPPPGFSWRNYLDSWGGGGPSEPGARG